MLDKVSVVFSLSNFGPPTHKKFLDPPLSGPRFIANYIGELNSISPVLKSISDSRDSSLEIKKRPSFDTHQQLTEIPFEL